MKSVGVRNKNQAKDGLRKRFGIIVVVLVVYVRGAEHPQVAVAGQCRTADKPL